jgi:hypothetical protein
MSKLSAKFSLWYLKQDSPIWKQVHEPQYRLLSASILGDICGVKDKHHAPKYHWECMKGLTQPKKDKFAEDVIMKWGKDHEPVAIDWAYKQLPNLLRGLQPGLVYHSDLNFIAASLDQLAYETHDECRGLVGMEIKCPWTRQIAKDRTEIKHIHLVQMQVQMACLPGLDIVYYVSWAPEEQAIYVIWRHEKLIEKILEKAKAFHASLELEECPFKRTFQDPSLTQLLEDCANQSLLIFSNFK